MIETERLLLRPFRMDDLDGLARILGDREVMRYLDLVGVASREWTEAWLEKHVALYERQGYGRVAVVECSSGRLVGRTGVARYEIAGRDELELGYTIERTSWGKGYATEAAGAYVRHAFDELGLPRIVSLIMAGHAASVRVAEKIGMSYERDVEWTGLPHMLFSQERLSSV